jgi:hypothetical protein
MAMRFEVSRFLHEYALVQIESITNGDVNM